MINSRLCCNQIIIRGELTIPDHKPEIETILRTTCTPLIIKTVTKNQYTIIFGELTIDMEYVALVPDGTQPIYFTSFKTSFADILKHNSVPKADKSYSVKVEYEEFEAVNKRAISKYIILRACSRSGVGLNDRSGHNTQTCESCSLK